MDADTDTVRARVREQYGKKATSTAEDCCSPGCCSPAGYSKEELARIPAEAFLGEGSGNPVRYATLTAGEVVVLASDEAFFRKVEGDLVKAGRRRVKLRIAIPDIPIEKDLEKSAELRSIVCSCMILVVDGQQVLTVTRTTENDAYGITSTDETLVRLGMEYWQSPRCCVACD